MTTVLNPIIQKVEEFKQVTLAAQQAAKLNNTIDTTSTCVSSMEGLLTNFTVDKETETNAVKITHLVDEYNNTARVFTLKAVDDKTTDDVYQVEITDTRNGKAYVAYKEYPAAGTPPQKFSQYNIN